MRQSIHIEQFTLSEWLFIIRHSEAVGKRFQDFAAALIDAALGETCRLREFGIRREMQDKTILWFYGGEIISPIIPIMR